MFNLYSFLYIKECFLLTRCSIPRQFESPVLSEAHNCLHSLRCLPPTVPFRPTDLQNCEHRNNLNAKTKFETFIELQL